MNPEGHLVCVPLRAILMDHYKNIVLVNLDNAGFVLFRALLHFICLSVSVCVPSVLYIDAPNADGHLQ